MVSFNIGIFLLAVPAFLVQAETIRGVPPEEVVQRDLQAQGYNERLGACYGATCGFWGDPHMVTCDGLFYDCQGIGSFNIMENHLYKIQGRFVDVGAHEKELVKGWGFTEGASLANDIAIEVKAFPDLPVIQFGFGDLSRHDGTFISEDGCTPYQYYNPTDKPGTDRTVEKNVQKCRERCDQVDGCTKFSWWADGGCHVNDDNQSERPSPRNWPRSLSGPKDECGLPPAVPELSDEEEKKKRGTIGNSCPLLMHLDGELVDISKVGAGDFYYGDQNSDVQIQNIHNIGILLRFKLSSGDYAESHFVVRGEGPGEMWSCHFDFYICLPASEKGKFLEPGSSTGLLGTPNGDPYDDFMDPDGKTIQIVNTANNWHKTLIDYCYDNHCVTPEDSILVPPNGMTFEDIKCEHVDYVPFDPESFNCVLTAEQIHEACDDEPAFAVHSCQLDCCLGGCDQITEIVEEIIEVKTLEEVDEENYILYDEPEPPVEACVEDKLEATSDSVCPSSKTEVVKLLSTSGSMKLPDKDIFYDIKMDSGGDEVGRTVKFRINNPLEEKADIYVKYGKSVLGHAFMDPHCDPFVATPSGCQSDAASIEVACHDYESVDPFALVQVFFASTKIEQGKAEIDECCLEGDEYLGDKGIVMYSFEIQCACPDTN